MAIYHLSVKTVSRSTGRSSVGAAAYRCGQRLTNERDGVTHDYRARTGVEHSEVILPENAPAWMADRAALWNSAEAAENRKDSKTAREYELALPHELDAQQRQELAREFGQHVAEKFGVAVDVSIHAPHPKTGDGPEIDAPGGDPRNFHAHVLTTTRRVTPDGLGEKTRELDVKQSSADLVEGLRAEWASMTNRALERAGVEARVDHRSYDRQGLAVTPTPHLGKESVQAMQDGVVNNRIEAYQQAKEAQVIDLAAERAKRQEKPVERAPRPSPIPRSFAEATRRAKDQHQVADRNRDGVQHVSKLPVASGPQQQRRRDPFGLLSGDARRGLREPVGSDGPVLPGQHQPVPGRDADLAWLKGVITDLEKAQAEAKRDAIPEYVGPDGQTRPLSVMRQGIKCRNRMDMSDARRVVQPDYDSARSRFEQAHDHRQDVAERAKEAGFLGRLFSPSLRKEMAQAEAEYQKAGSKLAKMDKAWASPKAQAWAADIVAKGDTALAKAEKRVEGAGKRLEAVSSSLTRQKGLYEALKGSEFKPTNGTEDRAERLRQLEEARRQEERRREEEAKKWAKQFGSDQGQGQGRSVSRPRPR